ncbi:MAG: hypothetical protein OES47_05755 [Acidobacteriota bacterium]|nr:hypothetical protein [Acidobacteriota bacterium]
MSVSQLLRLLRLPGSFLLHNEADLGRVVEEGARIPLPQRIFLEDEEATPVLGFPVLLTAGSGALRQALEHYILAEQELEIERIRGVATNDRKVDLAWSVYGTLLVEATNNAVSSSFGRLFPSIFWLYHSIAVSRVLKEVPAEIRRRHHDLGKTSGGAVKYRVFQRFLDRVLAETYEIVQNAGADTDEAEDELFPEILARMRDNVLILTEDHIGPDLRELTDFLDYSLYTDSADFLQRFEDLQGWHVQTMQENEELRGLVRSFYGLEHLTNPWQLMLRPGYLTFLSGLKHYDASKLFDPEYVRVWEQLLLRLKEFELLSDLRRYVVPIEERDGKFRCRAGVLRGLGTPRKEVVLSFTTRPLDFTNPLVVDPVVRRFGLVYDITDFSSIISILRRSGTAAQDLSFRRIFRFQRRVNSIASEHKAQLEKYLGDGALYSGRHPGLLLAAAIRLQRYYKRVVEEDFPFNRGMRVALNYAQYRLLPIQTVGVGHRYEFFGHGIVELSRLVTGKTTHELDEVRVFLLANGYSPEAVDRFFEPVSRGQTRRLSAEANEPFFSYIDHSGGLVNEGIVATEAFVEQLGEITLAGSCGVYRREGRRYLVFEVEDEAGAVAVGLRKLGSARLKGLGEVPIIQIVDAAPWAQSQIEPVAPGPLMELVEEQHRMAAASAGRA